MHPQLLLEARGINKTFGARQVLHGVDLLMLPQSIVGLVGESGCGKTTLSRIIVGLESFDRGFIKLNGESLSNKRPKHLKQQVQMLFQNSMGSFNPKFSVGSSLLLPLIEHRIYPTTSLAERAISDLTERLGMSPDLLTRYPHQLSGGQVQRMAFIRAVAMKPALIIADEPTSALDPKSKKQILDLIQLFRQEMNISFLVITHDIMSLKDTADEIIIMDKGYIIEAGKPRDIIEFPVENQTKKLILSIPSIHHSIRSFEQYKQLIQS